MGQSSTDLPLGYTTLFPSKMQPPYFLTALCGLTGAAVLDKRQSASATVPDYFQTTPEVFAGPTATAQHAPILAQSNPAPFGHEASFVPNAPLETALPIANVPNGTSIFQHAGQLSPYFPSPCKSPAQTWISLSHKQYLNNNVRLIDSKHHHEWVCHMERRAELPQKLAIHPWC